MHIKIYDFLLVFRFLSRKFGFDLKRVEFKYIFSGILTIHIHEGLDGVYWLENNGHF